MVSFAIIAPAITILLSGTIHIFHDSINLYFMGFFRDLARIKARKRRMTNNMAISSTTNSKDSGMSKKDLKMLFFKLEDEDPLQDVEIHFDIDTNGQIKVMQDEVNDTNNDSSSSLLNEFADLAEYTREELWEFGNGDNEEGVLLISLYGRVYDVTEGSKHYGEGGKYHKFAGRDVTRALSTGCMADSCLGSKHTSSSSSGNDDETANDRDNFDLSPEIIVEGKKWVSFFETHDSYHAVGILRDGQSIDEMVDEQLEMEEVEVEVEKQD